MLKIWLKLVLKGRCARKSRPVPEGFATRTMSDDWSQFEAFRKKIPYFFYFLPLEPGSSVQSDSGWLLLTPAGANLGPSHGITWYLAKYVVPSRCGHRLIERVRVREGSRRAD